MIDALRKNLRGMMKRSPLMNATNYTGEVGAVFIAILDAERNA